MQVDLHGLHVEEALQVLEQHLLSLGGLACPGGVLLQVGPFHPAAFRADPPKCCFSQLQC